MSSTYTQTCTHVYTPLFLITSKTQHLFQYEHLKWIKITVCDKSLLFWVIFGWLWMVVGGFLGSCGWLWMVFWVLVDVCGWFWVVEDGCGWLWVVVDACGWFFGWLWMVMGGCGWLCQIPKWDKTFYFFMVLTCIKNNWQ